MKRLSISVAVGILMVLVMGLTASAATNSVTVNLQAENNSGESGTATLTDMGNNQTKVVLNLTGAPAGVAQPVHIHDGNCGATLNPTPKYPLTSLKDGKSETTVNVSLATLMTGKFAINAHKSAAEASVYVSCGNIPAATAGTVAPQTGAGAGAGSSVALGLIAVLAIAGLGGGLFLRRRAAH